MIYSASVVFMVSSVLHVSQCRIIFLGAVCNMIPWEGFWFDHVPPMMWHHDYLPVTKSHSTLAEWVIHLSRVPALGPS